MAGYIHDDVKEIMEDAAENKRLDVVNARLPSTEGWTDDQLKSLDAMLQYAWNRGYKSAAKDLME
jgi:hypothetical protein